MFCSTTKLLLTLRLHVDEETVTESLISGRTVTSSIPLNQHIQYKYQAQRGKRALPLSKSGGLTQRCLCLLHTTVLYELERQCLLFIESDGTMFHLNLLRSCHLGLCRLIRCLAVSISMAFTSRTPLSSDLSAKKTEQKKCLI